MNHPFRLGDTRLSTQRLLLRPWQVEDAADFYEYARVPGVGEMAGWLPHESIEVSREKLLEFIENQNVLALELKENGKVIGSFGFHPSWTDKDPSYSHLKALEVGYILSKDYWGMGLMPEALREVLRFCFDELKLDAVAVGHCKINDRSRRVIEKNGFTFIKETDYYSKQMDKHFDDMKYLMLRKDYEALRSR